MANTLDNLIPDLYANLDVVSRELVGFIPAVTMDADAARAALGQTVRSPVAPAAAAQDVTPGVTSPNAGDQVIGNQAISISKSRAVPIRWNGEQSRGMNTGAGVGTLRGQQIQQAFRTLTNEIEADLAALHVSASRAAGTAGTTPFATAGDYTAAALSRKILVDNGSPESDLHLNRAGDAPAGAAGGWRQRARSHDNRRSALGPRVRGVHVRAVSPDVLGDRDRLGAVHDQAGARRSAARLIGGHVMARLPTVFVTLKGDKTAPGRLINEADFDKDLHVKAKPPAPPAAEPDAAEATGDAKE